MQRPLEGGMENYDNRISENGKIIINTFRPLTPRTNEVFRCLGKGMTADETADELRIGKGTVRTYYGHLKSRLRIRDMKQLRYLARLWETGMLRILSKIPPKA